MYIVQGLVLGMCVFFSWYQKYKLKRLALYFRALRSLGYIEDNISVYAKYFYPHSGKSNENSYIKTFNNMKALMQGSPLLSSAMSEMKNLVES
jgi:hypothetical protein